MDENDIAKAPMKVVATTSSRIKDLTIEDGQLIFLQDTRRIALDFNGKRVFYNQIDELETEHDRTSLSNPDYGYYFVIETAVLWLYRDGWIQVTGEPNNIVFVGDGVELPELGKKKTLYVDTANKSLSVYDDNANAYVVVADSTDIVGEEDIEALFPDMQV